MEHKRSFVLDEAAEDEAEANAQAEIEAARSLENLQVKRLKLIASIAEGELSLKRLKENLQRVVVLIGGLTEQRRRVSSTS